MSKARQAAELAATLFVFWVLLNGTLAPDTLAVGLVAALVIALVVDGGYSVLHGYRLTPRGLVATARFCATFLGELVRANIALAAIILSPALPIRPGIVTVRTRLKSPVGRLLLANAITLTPGTLTVALDGDRLYVHWVTVASADIEAATAAIVSGFERDLAVMYG